MSKEFLKKLKDEGKINQERYDAGIVKLDAKEQEKADYVARKSKLTDKQKLDRIEKFLGL